MEKENCVNCKHFRIHLKTKAVNNKWVLGTTCINTDRYGRSLRAERKVDSYEAYRDEVKKPMPKFQYMMNLLDNKGKIFDVINKPIWCRGFEKKGS